MTDIVSRSENDQQDQIDERIDHFLTNYEDRAHRYPRRLILNTDQTPFNYELTNQRTLSFIGERDTRLAVDQKNKVSHSFTAQPTITRDGKTFGKLYLVLQESNGRFGTQIGPRVRRLEETFGNIRVLASKSGKLTTDHVRQWIADILYPAVRDGITSIDTDTDIGSDFETMSIDDEVFADDIRRQGATTVPPTNSSGLRSNYRQAHTLLIADSWSGQTNRDLLEDLRQNGIEFLEVPKLTTKYLQPLDVYFNRQYKIFAKRIFEASIDPRNEYPIANLTSRWGAINLHSLIWNQFGSEAYTDMIRYAWHNTDPHFSTDEMRRPAPRGVIEN